MSFQRKAMQSLFKDPPFANVAAFRQKLQGPNFFLAETAMWSIYRFFKIFCTSLISIKLRSSAEKGHFLKVLSAMAYAGVLTI